MNHEGRQLCSVCASPIRSQIDDALDKKENLRTLAQRSGISRATLSRHNRRCRSNRAIANYKTKTGNSSGRTLVAWQGGEFSAFPHGAFFTLTVDKRGRIVNQDMDPAEVTDADDIYRLEYADPLPLEPEANDPAEKQNLVSAENEIPNSRAE